MGKLRVLILAGTVEARHLAALVATESDICGVASLAGVTQSPKKYGLQTRVGGFGGQAGLAHYLQQGRFDVLVDATHPFAAQMSQNAVDAVATCAIPLVRLRRKEWAQHKSIKWQNFNNLDDALAALPTNGKAFLATGSKSIAAVARNPTKHLYLRVIEEPAQPFPNPAGGFIVARPPYPEADEMALFERLKITHLISKNSGGTASQAKLHAAARLGLTINMVARPTEHAEAVVETPHEVLAILTTMVANKRRGAAS